MNQANAHRGDRHHTVDRGPGLGLLHRMLLEAESVLDAVLRPFRSDPEAVTVVGHLGHGTVDGLVVRGRLLAGVPAPGPSGVEPLVQRLRRSVASFVTHELSGAALILDVAGTPVRVVTDEEGHFIARWSDPQLVLSSGIRQEVRVMDVELADQVRPTCHVTDDLAAIIDSRSAVSAIVSDLDDTILSTGVRRPASMVLRTITGSAWTRHAVDGMPELLQRLTTGGGSNSCFYVSSSPWNLYGFLSSFLRRQGCSDGPLFLTEYGISEESFFRLDHRSHKLDAIREVYDLHPELALVMIGDTTEADPGIYATVVAESPNRVDAVLLHDDGNDPAARQSAEDLMSELPVPWAIGDAESLHSAAAEFGLLDG